MKKMFLSFALTFFLFTFSHAQIKMPSSSPTFEVKGAIGLSDVTVVYSRPSAKGRKIFGDVVPYGHIWRTGANAATKIVFTNDVEIEGYEVPAGEYAIYTIPKEKFWTIIISKNTSWWGVNGYNKDEDLVRFDVATKSTSSHYETFTISFSDFTTNSAILNMKWEKSKAQFKIKTEVDEAVMVQINEKLIDNPSPTPQDCYAGASYFYDTQRDMSQALSWVDISIGDKETYWKYYLKARILVRLEKNKEAITASKKSKELAEGGVNPDYVRLNEKLIAALEE